MQLHAVSRTWSNVALNDVILTYIYTAKPRIVKSSWVKGEGQMKSLWWRWNSDRDDSRQFSRKKVAEKAAWKVESGVDIIERRASTEKESAYETARML
jgi:hypothetical protein